MPSLRNGTGTAFFGASRRQSDGSFVTTKWFVLFDLPLIPLGSSRVRYLGGESGIFRETDRYQIVERATLDLMRVFAVYAWILIPPVLLVAIEPWIPRFGEFMIGPLRVSRDLYLPGIFVLGIAFWVFVFPSLYKAK